MTRIALPLWMVLLLPLLLGGCTAQEKEDGLRSRLHQYASVIRWNDIERAESFLAPELRDSLRMDSLTRERWRALQVARYDDAPYVADANGDILQVVQIDLIVRANQTMRRIIDRQRWRYDPAAKTWWLMSGLPDLDARVD